MLRSCLLDGMGHRRNGFRSHETIGTLMIVLVNPTRLITLIYRADNTKSIVFTMNRTMLSEQIIVLYG